MSSVTSSTPLPSTSRLCTVCAVVGDVEGHRAGLHRRVGRIDLVLGLGDRRRSRRRRTPRWSTARGVARRRSVVLRRSGRRRRRRRRARTGSRPRSARPGACGARMTSSGRLEFIPVDTGERAARDWSDAQSAAAQGPYNLTLIWSPSDEALVAGLAAGDSTAATAFVRRFQARVFGLARDAWSATARSPRRSPRRRSPAPGATPAPTTPAAGGSRPGCSRSPATSRSTTCARSAPSRSTRTRSATPSARCGRPPPTRPRPSRARAELRDSLAELPADQRRALLLAALFGFTAREIGEIE